MVIIRVGLSWEGLKTLGECTIYDRTAPEEVLERAAGAEAILTNKVVITAEQMAALPDLKYIGVLATGILVTTIPRSRAALMSMMLYPVASTPIYFKSGRAAICSAVIYPGKV